MRTKPQELCGQEAVRGENHPYFESNTALSATTTHARPASVPSETRCVTVAPRAPQAPDPVRSGRSRNAPRRGTDFPQAAAGSPFRAVAPHLSGW